MTKECTIWTIEEEIRKYDDRLNRESACELVLN